MGGLTTTQSAEVLVVEVDGRRYGVLAADVDEVLSMVEVTPLPGAPEVVSGVIDRHGGAVAVVDARRRLDAPARAVRPSDRLVVVSVGATTLALHVDAAIDVVVVDLAEVSERLPAGEHVAGVAPTEAGLLVIYDLAAFLTGDERGLLAAALQEREAAHGGARS